MGNVEFKDNTAKVIEMLEQEAIAFLYEAGGELLSQVKRNASKTTKTTSTMNAWELIVDERGLTATVGNPMQNAIWEEFGTGEFAHNGDGRKGWWVYVAGGTVRSNNVKEYTYEKAKQVVAIMRSKGLDAHMTQGKHPKYHLTKAFETTKPKIKRRLEKITKG